MQSRRPASAGACAPHDHHCRSVRSIGHFPGRRFFQRGDATRRSRQPLARLRRNRNAPMIEPDCTAAPDRCRPGRACTIRTTRRAGRHNEHAGRDDRDDDESELPRSSIPTHIEQPSWLRSYALLLEILCRGDRINAIKTAALRGTLLVQRHDRLHENSSSGSRLTGGFYGISGGQNTAQSPISRARPCAGRGGKYRCKVNAKSTANILRSAAVFALISQDYFGCIPALLRLFATALMKPSRASEWPCPRGSSTWRSRNNPVSRKPSCKS